MIDVLIIGDGVAGLAASIALRQKGITVTIAHRNTNTHQVRAGESLSSSALIALAELGLSNEFLAAAHQPCHGNSSCWGNNQLAYFDFIQSPLGNGWYIDRPKFNGMLRQKAIDMGACFITSAGPANLMKNNDGTWRFTSDERNAGFVNARMLVDASGRNTWLARKLGIRRVNGDQQIAIVALFGSGQCLPNAHSLIEAVTDGWWYVADGGHGKTVCIFFTDPDIHDRDKLADPEYFNLKKEQTIFVKHRVAGHNNKLIKPPELTAAGSSYLAHFYGPGWLVAGDAACAMDPLSAHGISFALRSGIDAGLAANCALQGSLVECTRYNEDLGNAVRIYDEQRSKIYLQETRWPSSVYWRRRHEKV